MKLYELGNERSHLDKEFPRNIMPQIRIEHLKDSPFTYSQGVELTANLKPVQHQRVAGMADRAKRGFADGTIRPIIVDQNNYIVNGHHRYDVARGTELARVDIIRVNASIEELIKHFSDTVSKAPTMKEQLKINLDLAIRLREAKRIDEVYPAIAWGILRSFITKHGAKAAALWLLKWMFTNVFVLGTMVIITLVQIIVSAVVKGTVTGLSKAGSLLHSKIKEKVGEKKAQRLMEQLEADLEKELNQEVNKDRSISNVNMTTENEVRVLTKQEVTDLAKELLKSMKAKRTDEGEERSIIRDAVVQNLVDTFGEQPGLFADNQEELIAKMYAELEAMAVEDVVDAEMEVGGQPIGNFASGRVLDVVSANEVIETALQHVNLADLEEAKSKKSELPKQNNPVAKHSRNMSGAGSHKSTKDYNRKDKKKDISSQLDEAPYVASRSTIIDQILTILKDKAYTDDNLLKHLAELIGKKVSQRNANNHKTNRNSNWQSEAVVTEKDPCWKGYKQIGMKKKGNKEVPNCVPTKK
tara:strand:+ start:2170 stop:3750 length:1581 start_codon:yes stop_codon:yes gene_type:complete